jgi:hypothetical protein
MYDNATNMLVPSGAWNIGGAGGSSGGSGGGGGGGGGGVGSKLRDAEKGYREFMLKTGGWDPARLARADATVEKLKSLGYDPETVERMRGAGVYDEFAKTGGYSEGDRSNIRQRATSGIPMFYGRMRDEANRLGTVQGGYGPAQAALMSRMGRSQSGAAADAALNAELGIMDKVNAGRQWGATGMTEAESALSGLRLSSLGQAGTQELGIGNSLQQGRMFGVSGLDAMGQAAANRAAYSSSSSAANQAAMDRWANEFAFERQQAGLEGLGSLYSAVPNEYMMNKQFDLDNRQVTNQTRTNIAGMYRPGEGGGINWGQIAGAGASAYSTWASSRNQGGNTGGSTRP